MLVNWSTFKLIRKLAWWRSEASSRLCMLTTDCQTEGEGILLKAELGWRRSSAQMVESTAHTCGVSSSTRAYLSCPRRAGWFKEAHLIAADAQWKT